MLRRLLLLLLTCHVVHVAAPVLSAQSGGQGGKVQVNLDPLLAFPSLWEKTQDTVASAFMEAGVKQSPQFSWLGRTKGGKDVALFDAKPYSDTGALLSIFAGKVPVDSAGVYFSGGKVSHMIVQSPRARRISIRCELPSRATWAPCFLPRRCRSHSCAALRERRECRSRSGEMPAPWL